MQVLHQKKLYKKRKKKILKLLLLKFGNSTKFYIWRPGNAGKRITLQKRFRKLGHQQFHFKKS